MLKKSSKKSWFIVLLALLPVALMLLPDLAYAASAAIGATQPASCQPFPACIWLKVLNFTPASTDISVHLLQQIFGRVPSLLAGPTSTVLGNLFGIFNNAIGGIIGVIVVYSTARMIFDTAKDGEPLGKKGSYFLIVRTTAGMGMVVPTASGYSVIQILVMWVTLQGIGFADSVWNGTLDYLQAGHPFYSSINKTANAAPGTDKIISISLKSITGNAEGKEDSGADEIGSSGILRSLVCMHSLENAFATEQKQRQLDIAFNPKRFPRGSAQLAEAKNFINATFLFHPTYKDGIAYFPGTSKLDNTAGVDVDQLNGACGTYRWDWPKASAKDKQIYIPQKLVALQQMVNYLDPFAEDIARNPSRILDDDISTRTLNAAINYQASLHNVRMLAGQGYKNKPKKTSKARGKQMTTPMYNLAKAQGWVTAGSFYYLMAQARDTAADDLDNAHYLITASGTYGKKKKRLIGAPFVNAAGKLNNSKLETWFKNHPNVRNALATQLNRLNDTTQKSVTLANNLNEAQGIGGDLPAGIQGMKELSGFITQFSKMDPYTMPTPLGINLPEISTPHGSYCLMNKKFKILGKKFRVKIGCIKAKKHVIMKPYNLDPALIIFAPAVKRIANIFVDWRSIMINNCLDTTLHLKKTGQACKKAATPAPMPIEKLRLLGNSMMYNSISAFLDMAKRLKIFILSFMAINVVGQGIALITSALPTFSFGPTISTALNTIFGLGFQYFTLSAGILAPIVLGILVPMFTLGVTLSIYVPLIPFIFFTAGVISWLMFVIEAMSAAPLVALGITHPEGHDLLGKAAQSLMLLFAVFLRPVTMIMGLIAAMIFSYVALDLVNVTFSTITGSIGLLGGSTAMTSNQLPSWVGTGLGAVTGGAIGTGLGIGGAYTDSFGHFISNKNLFIAGAKAGGQYGAAAGSDLIFTAKTLSATQIIAVMKYCFTMIIYTSLVMSIVNQTFSLIYVLPEKVGDWIGLHPRKDALAKEMAGDVSKGMQPVTEAFSGIGKEGLGGHVKGAGAATPNKQVFKFKEKEKDDGKGKGAETGASKGGGMGA